MPERRVPSSDWRGKTPGQEKLERRVKRARVKQTPLPELTAEEEARLKAMDRMAWHVYLNEKDRESELEPLEKAPTATSIRRARQRIFAEYGASHPEARVPPTRPPSYKDWLASGWASPLVDGYVKATHHDEYHMWVGRTYNESGARYCGLCQSRPDVYQAPDPMRGEVGRSFGAWRSGRTYW